MSYYAPSISSQALSAASSGQALSITWAHNQYFLQPTMRTRISGFINQCAEEMRTETYHPYHAHLISGLHGSHSDNRRHYTFKIWAQKYVTKYDVNPQGHTSTEKFCFTYHYYDDDDGDKYRRWPCAVEDVPSSTPSSEPTTASDWVWDHSHQKYRRVVNGVWVWQSTS